MSVFLQIVLINLAVSCDNVGVIAMATRGLPDRQAACMRRLGIGLAPVFTLAFIWAAGRLLDISWLHLRLLGGAAMLYVTWQMLKDGACCGTSGCAAGATDFSAGPTVCPARSTVSSVPEIPCSCAGRTRLAAVSILASDLTMAMENAIAVLSLLSEGGRVPDSRGFLTAAFSLLVCLPVLFWGSGLVARMMEEVPAVSSLFAGYMAYTAVTMALQDESVVLFLSAVHFRHSLPAAVAAGILTAAAGCDMRREQEARAALCRTGAPRRPRGLPLLPYAAVLIYALATVHVFFHLAKGPVIHGIGVSPELMFGFTPSGADAVRAVGAPPHLLSLFTCLLAVRSVILRRRTGAALERIPAGMHAHSRHDCALCAALRRWLFPAVRPRHTLPSGPVVPPGIADPASLFLCGPVLRPGRSGQKPGRRHNPRYFLPYDGRHSGGCVLLLRPPAGPGRIPAGILHSRPVLPPLKCDSGRAVRAGSRYPYSALLHCGEKAAASGQSIRLINNSRKKNRGFPPSARFPCPSRPFRAASIKLS